MCIRDSYEAEAANAEGAEGAEGASADDDVVDAEVVDDAEDEKK